MNFNPSKRWLIDYRYELSQWIDDPKNLSVPQLVREYLSTKRGVAQHDSRSANHQ